MAFSDAEMLHALPADEARVEYSDRGEGEAILLIHAGVFGAWFAPLAVAGRHPLGSTAGQKIPASAVPRRGDAGS